MGVTPDRWVFYSDPSIVGNEAYKPASPGLIKIDFAVEPVANLLPAPEVRSPLVDELGNATTEALIPHLPNGIWTTIGDMPTLSVRYGEEELRQEHAGLFTEATSVYILGDRLVYYLWIAYAPSDNDREAYNNFSEIQDFILQSFTINPEPLAAWHPTQ